MTERINTKQEMIERIKDCGKYITENAESIVGSEEYLRDLSITCYFFNHSEPPYVSINKDVIPESFIERFK